MMKLELRKIYEAADANAGLGGGAGGVAKDFDYSQVEAALTKMEAKQVEIQIKYEGYIKLQEDQVEKFKKLEKKLLHLN